MVLPVPVGICFVRFCVRAGGGGWEEGREEESEGEVEFLTSIPHAQSLHPSLSMSFSSSSLFSLAPPSTVRGACPRHHSSLTSSRQWPLASSARFSSSMYWNCSG